MTDVHCHLNFKAFEKDYDEIIKNAFEAGVGKIINVGTKIDSSQRAVELAEKYDNLFAIVGVHPHHADKIELGSNWINELERIAKQPKVVAIGEIGMDNYRYQSNGTVDLATQKEVFIKQIELANKLKLPLQIHNRQAGKEILALLNEYKSLLQANPGMFHCFSGNIEFLRHVLELGFYVGFDGNITYEGLAKGEDTLLSDLVKEAPIERIVIETDSPYLTPEPHRGSRNEPKYVILIARFIAKLKNLPLDQVVNQTTSNANTLFKLI